jgi:hypothetical protein
LIAIVGPSLAPRRGILLAVPRYAAFLRGVSPMNAKMPQLKSAFRLPPETKRIVTFLHGTPSSELALPIELHGARILSMKGGEIFSAYVPNPKGPVFMRLIEKMFGKELTTRTWDTVAKVARRATRSGGMLRVGVCLR